MAKVFRVEPDIDEFQYLLPSSLESVQRFEFNGHPLGDSWEPPEVYVPHPLKPQADFLGYLGRGAAMAVRKDFPDAITTFLEASCECLPMPCDVGEFVVLNVVYVLNCLDHSACSPRGDHRSTTETYEFYERRLGRSLFKIPESAGLEILCSEGAGVHPDDGFRMTVLRNGLTGLRFTELWSSE